MLSKKYVQFQQNRRLNFNTPYDSTVGDKIMIFLGQINTWNLKALSSYEKFYSALENKSFCQRLYRSNPEMRFDMKLNQYWLIR